MDEKKNIMRCPVCGTEMNRHAEKIVYTGSGDPDETGDPVLGGTIEEFHTCPVCGAAASRRESAS